MLIQELDRIRRDLTTIRQARSDMISRHTYVADVTWLLRELDRLRIYGQHDPGDNFQSSPHDG